MAKAVVCVCLLLLLLLNMVFSALFEGGMTKATAVLAPRAATHTTDEADAAKSRLASELKTVLRSISTVNSWVSTFKGLGSMASESESDEMATTSSSSKSFSRSTPSSQSASTSSSRSHSSSDEDETATSEEDGSSTSTSRSSSSTSESDPSSDNEETSVSSSPSSSTVPASTTSDSSSTFSTITSMPPLPTPVPTLSAAPTTSINPTVSPTSSASPTPAPAAESSSPLGAILGASIGGLVGLLLIGFIISWFIRYRKDKRRHAAQSPDDYVPRAWPDNRPYDPNRNTSMENTNTNNYTRSAARTRPLSSIGAGRFYASSSSAANVPLPRTPTTPAFAEVDPTTQIHEAPTQSASAPAPGDAMEMRSNPAMPNSTSSANTRLGTSMQDQNGTGHQYRGVAMTNQQIPESLQPGYRRHGTPPWVTASELYAQQHGGQQWRAPAW